MANILKAQKIFLVCIFLLPLFLPHLAQVSLLGPHSMFRDIPFLYINLARTEPTLHSLGRMRL